jgi:hypothetical protein
MTAGDGAAYTSLWMDDYHLFLAMSRAALIRGVKVRRGSEILKKGCCEQTMSIPQSLIAEMLARKFYL